VLLLRVTLLRIQVQSGQNVHFLLALFSVIVPLSLPFCFAAIILLSLGDRDERPSAHGYARSR